MIKRFTDINESSNFDNLAYDMDVRVDLQISKGQAKMIIDYAIERLGEDKVRFHGVIPIVTAVVKHFMDNLFAEDPTFEELSVWFEDNKEDVIDIIIDTI